MTTSRSTALIVAGGILGGFAVARVTNVRAIGGLVLSVAGAAAGREWSRDDALTATALGAVYTGAFALSHPLAKKIGPWPAVLLAASVAAGAAWALHDRQHGSRRPDQVEGG